MRWKRNQLAEWLFMCRSMQETSPDIWSSAVPLIVCDVSSASAHDLHSSGEKLRFVFKGKVFLGVDSHVCGKPALQFVVHVFMKRKKKWDGGGGC